MKTECPTANHAKRGKQGTCPALAGYPMTKTKETSGHRTVFDIAVQSLHLSSNVRLDIPCWLLDIQIPCTFSFFRVDRGLP